LKEDSKVTTAIPQYSILTPCLKMAAHESLHEYYLHQHRNIEHYLELCSSHPEAELVHELRLCIKRLRAFHKLAEQLYSDGMVEHIHMKHRVRQLYNVAGQLRDTQVQIDMFTSLEEQTGMKYPEFGKWLLRREKKRIRRFGKKPEQVVPQTTSQSTHEKIGNLLALADDETILENAGNVLFGLYSMAKKLSGGNSNDKDLHQLRRITKQMRYIISIMTHSYPDYTYKAISVKSLREIEVAAGHWHDNLVRIVLLGKFMEKKKFIDDSLELKYQELFNKCKSLLDTSYNEAYGLVRNTLLQ